MALELPPFPRPAGIFDAYMAPSSKTLVLKEKLVSLTGDSFDIMMLDDQARASADPMRNARPFLRVAGKKMTISGRKSVYDTADNHLFDIVKEHFHLVHATFAVEDPSGNKILEVTNNFKLFGSKATATFTSKAGKKEALTMSGKWTDFSAQIVDENDAVAATLRREIKAKDFFFGKQMYMVTVAPGVDMALIAAICICFDEKNNEK